MSDQQPPQNGDTAAVAGPDEAHGTAETQPQVDWEKRYQDLQPEYTRATQRAKELEERQSLFEIAMTTEDPDTQRQALERLGYDVPDETEDAEPAEYFDEDDPTQTLLERQNRLEQEISRMTEQQREAAQFEYLANYVDDQVESLGMSELDENTRHWILQRAMNMPIEQKPGSIVEALPDVKGAYEAFQAWEQERQKQWASTKRSPYVAPGGRPASEVPNSGTGHNARMERAMRYIHNNQGDE